MPIHDTPFRPGRPCWADVSVPDTDAAAAFYAALLGWEVGPPDPEARGYRMATLDGRVVAGIGPTMSPDQPSAWATYFAADDVDAAAAAITAAGGTVLMEPMDVLESGRMLFAADTVGAVFGVWQARGHHGWQLTSDPGAVCWTEHYSFDRGRAREFLGATFGYTFEEMPLPQGGTYVMGVEDGDQVVGLFDLTGIAPAGSPAYWNTWFRVTDTAASVARAEGLGARVLQPPTPSGWGTMSTLQGPQGEIFGIVDSGTA